MQHRVLFYGYAAMFLVILSMTLSNQVMLNSVLNPKQDNWDDDDDEPAKAEPSAPSDPNAPKATQVKKKKKLADIIAEKEAAKQVRFQ